MSSLYNCVVRLDPYTQHRCSIILLKPGSVRKLAEGCRTILAVIHQPSSETFELFDKLCLLASGDTVYFGDANRAQDMFAAAGLPVPITRSAPDHFLHCINADFKADDHDIDENIRVLASIYNASKVFKAVKEKVIALHGMHADLFFLQVHSVCTLLYMVSESSSRLIFPFFYVLNLRLQRILVNHTKSPSSSLVGCIKQASSQLAPLSTTGATSECFG